MHRPITANGVARLLKRYDIRPLNIGPKKTTVPTECTVGESGNVNEIKEVNW